MNIKLYVLADEYADKFYEYQKEESYYQEALKIEPENERIILKYAEFLNYMASYEDILELFAQVPEQIQQLPEAMWILATANNELDEYDKARHLLDQASSYLEDNVDCLKA